MIFFFGRRHFYFLAKNRKIMFGVPKPFRIGKTFSQIIVVLYIAFTLYLRFTIEAQLQGMWMISLIVGAIFLVMLWAMIKIRILNPGWLGESSRD
jgi:hypothetical protein